MITRKSRILPLTPEEISEAEERARLEIIDRQQEDRRKEDNFTFDGVMLVIAKALHNHENRLRALEGRQEVTLKQLIQALRLL